MLPPCCVTALVDPEGTVLGPCLVLRVRGAAIAVASATAAQRASGLGIQHGHERIELARARATRAIGCVTFDLGRDALQALSIAGLDDDAALATLDHARGGDAFVIGVTKREGCIVLVRVAVRIERIDTATRGGSGDDVTYFRAHLVGARPPEDVALDGAPLFASHAASRALGTPASTLLYGIACTASVSRLYTPDGHEPPFAELVELERALAP